MKLLDQAEEFGHLLHGGLGKLAGETCYSCTVSSKQLTICRAVAGTYIGELVSLAALYVKLFSHHYQVLMLLPWKREDMGVCKIASFV